jgi:hypothetical protein
MVKPITLAAAEGFVKAVKPGDVVIMSTGWCLPPRLGVDWIPSGENDGPSGTIALADALTKGLGAKIIFMQEEAMIPVLEHGCLASGIRVFTLEELKKMPRESNQLKRAAVTSFPIDQKKAEKAAPKVIDELKPKALIAVEKSGRNENGIYHPATGRDMSSTTCKVDLVFDEARSRGIFTAASLDSGNEIGGGTVIDTIHSPTYDGGSFAKYLRKCVCGCGGGAASIVPVDALVVASSSNLGCVGIAAVLSGLIEKDGTLIQDADTFRRNVWECVRGGTVCGNRLIPSITIH